VLSIRRIANILFASLWKQADSLDPLSGGPGSGVYRSTDAAHVEKTGDMVFPKEKKDKNPPPCQKNPPLTPPPPSGLPCSKFRRDLRH